uniref:VWFA domain-containing protein n=1 Tax=Ciona intestinalis TaxID=7719 RepID=H2XS73_CIOIN
MTLNFDISRDTTRVAVVQYSSYPRTEFDLDTYSSAVGVLRGIDLIQYMSGIALSMFTLCITFTLGRFEQIFHF